MRPSILFLMMTGLGRKRVLSCSVTWNGLNDQRLKRALTADHTYLCHQTRVSHSLSGFHNPNDRSLDLMLAVLIHFGSGLFALRFGLSLRGDWVVGSENMSHCHWPSPMLCIPAWILTRCSLDENESLTMNTWFGSSRESKDNCRYISIIE